MQFETRSMQLRFTITCIIYVFTFIAGTWICCIRTKNDSPGLEFGMRTFAWPAMMYYWCWVIVFQAILNGSIKYKFYITRPRNTCMWETSVWMLSVSGVFARYQLTSSCWIPAIGGSCNTALWEILIQFCVVEVTVVQYYNIIVGI